jgi:4a-hydroxytetrahydrobiopterin dehydratase
MSRQGWRDFLAADGVEEWVVLHGGAAAAYDVGSIAEAGALASEITQVPGVADSGVLLTLGDRRLTVRLTRGLGLLGPHHIDLARAISKVARRRGAVADRGAVQEVQLAVAARPGDLDVDFWRAVLGYDPLADDNGVDPLGHGSTFWMQDLDPAKPLRHAMHVDVSVAREHAVRRLEAALAAGGRVVEESAAPAWWILSDRAGNRVCIASWPDGAEPRSGDRGGDQSNGGPG